jgi:hypothetical protein
MRFCDGQGKKQVIDVATGEPIYEHVVMRHKSGRISSPHPLAKKAAAIFRESPIDRPAESKS